MDRSGGSLDFLLMAVGKTPAMAHARFLHGGGKRPDFAGFCRLVVQ